MYQNCYKPKINKKLGGRGKIILNISETLRYTVKTSYWTWKSYDMTYHKYITTWLCSICKGHIEVKGQIWCQSESLDMLHWNNLPNLYETCNTEPPEPYAYQLNEVIGKPGWKSWNYN